MIEPSKRDWLAARRAHYSSELREAAGREARASWSRLGVFLAFVGLWIGFAGQPWIAGGGSLALVVVFVACVKWHHRLKDAREFLDRLILATDESLRRVDGQVDCIRDWRRPVDDPTEPALPVLWDDGPSWALTDQERDDLDLYAAPVGIFGLLNRCSTAIGARKLRDALDQPLLDGEFIQRRQAAIQRLTQQPESRLRLLAAAAVLRREDERLGKLIRAFTTAEALSLPLPVGALRIWSVLTAAALLVGLVQTFAGHLQWGWLIGAVISVNSALFAVLARRLSYALTPWQDTAWAVRGYLIAARQAATDLPHETQLGDLRSRFEAVLDSNSLPRLARRVGWAEGGGLVHLLLNVIAMHDVHVAHSILRIVHPNRLRLLEGLSALAQLEALASLTCFAWEQPGAHFPALASRSPLLRITSGRHPLVPPLRVVPNTLQLDTNTRLWIVTGSNMAGKSTLLRMIGVNVLLGQLGAAVSADEMEWSPMRLVSDLRARDSLAASESYFLSEVRHLRRMVVPPAGAEPILGLIDEPFRGTNSQDQSAASVAVVRHLLKSPHLFVLATHDRNLTELADGKLALNYHFRENLGSDGMVFDYKLHDGPAQTRNALRILEREGYPPELLRHAHDWLGESEDSRPVSASGGAQLGSAAKGGMLSP